MASKMQFGKGAPSWVDESLFQEAIKQVRDDMLFYARLPEERLHFRLQSGFETACWTFSGHVHNVFLGTAIFSNPAAKKVTNRNDAVEYLKSFLNHEVGHALNTLDEIRKRMTDKILHMTVKSVHDAMDMLVKVLASKRVPFQLWNLFEDARIEELERVYNKRRFNWAKYEYLHKSGTALSARKLFFMLIQNEGDRTAVESAIVADPAVDLALLERAWFYYDNVRRCLRTTDLIPFLEQWVKEFPADAQSSSKPPPDMEGLQDLGLSFSLSTDADKLEAFMESSKGEDEFGDKDGESHTPPELSGIKPDMNERAFNGTGMLDSYAPANEAVDIARVNEVLSRFKRFKTETRVKQYREEPSKRYSVRHDLRGLSPYRHDVVEPKPVIDCTVYLDCSGSMRGKPMHEAKILIAALSALATSGRVKGHLILCTTTRSSTLFHRLKFPVSMDELNRIRSHNGGEGLEAAMCDPKNLSLTSRARHTFVITDSNLTDEPLNKAKLQGRGISTTAIYVGQHANEEKMRTYFDRYLIRDRIEDIVEELIKLSLR